MVEKEALEAWHSLVKNLPSISQSIRERIAETERDAQEDSSKYLEFWFSILDEGLSLLVMLQEIAEESFDNLIEKPSPSFLFLMSRACTLIVPVRRLLLNGLEDAARPVARSFLETLDLALVTLTDDQFSTDFMGSEISDENYSDVFWKNNMTRGKIEMRIKDTFQLATISDDAKIAILEFRKNSRKTLSSSVHSSMESAFRSYYVPSLAKPGILTKSIFGHISIHSPGLLSFMIRAIYLYSFPILLLCRVEERPKALAGEISKEKEDSAANVFFALDKMLRDYDHLFPPPLEIPGE